jgi:hypothetical protein
MYSKPVDQPMCRALPGGDCVPCSSIPGFDSRDPGDMRYKSFERCPTATVSIAQAIGNQNGGAELRTVDSPPKCACE